MKALMEALVAELAKESSLKTLAKGDVRVYASWPNPTSTITMAVTAPFFLTYQKDDMDEDEHQGEGRFTCPPKCTWELGIVGYTAGAVDDVEEAILDIVQSVVQITTPTLECVGVKWLGSTSVSQQLSNGLYPARIGAIEFGEPKRKTGLTARIITTT